MLVLELELLAVCVLLQGRAIVAPVRGAAGYSPLPMTRPPVASSGGAVHRLWPLGLYTLLSLLLFGLPVLGHFGSRIVAADAIDSSAFMWFFAWWPHALLHGLNPFVTHAMFVPNGYNLSWSTTMPGPAILLSPVTLAFGPAVTWNVIQLLSPALSGWTAFLLCRQLGARTWPSLLGGYVFGFSPYMLVHLTGGPHLALVALLPVFVLLVLRRIDGSMQPRRFVITMTAALTAQYLVAGEVLATATLFGGIALILAYALYAEHRAALIDVTKLTVVAYAATVVLISPFLLFFFFGHQYPPGDTHFSADLAAFALPPSSLIALTRHQPAFVGSIPETYLGLPLIILVGLFVWQERHSRRSWLIALTLLIAAAFSLGRHLNVRHQQTSIPMPWDLVAQLPVLRYAIPVRFALFVALPAALIVALWLSSSSLRGSRQIGAAALAVLVIASIVPDVGSSAWNTHIADPAFFSSGSYRGYLKPSDNVLTIPVWGANERWQADTGFRFNLSAGYAGQQFPQEYARYPTWNTLLTGRLTPDYAAQLRRFVADKRVTAVVVDQTVPGPWRTLFGSLGVKPVATGGVLLYRLRST